MFIIGNFEYVFNLYKSNAINQISRTMVKVYDTLGNNRLDSFEI